MRVVLISLTVDTTELEALVRTLGFEIGQTFIQHRSRPHPRHFIGAGKIEEIKAFIEDEKITIGVINGALKPNQLLNLHRALDIEIYDRIRVVLEIFTAHAHRREARLQVELARLQYELPFVRELIHHSRHGEHPGFMAMGEYQIDQYYEMIRRRMRKIRGELEKIRVARGIRRRHRRKRGFFLASVVGYTNAGKSTLMNSLTNECIPTDDQLFSTLSTTTRIIDGMGFPVLLSDTVGFLEDLPHWLIEAFHSTLEEIYLSDVILLVVDISEPIGEIKRKLTTCLEVLWSFEHPLKLLIVANKIDLISGDELVEKLEKLKPFEFNVQPIPVSARSGVGLEALRRTLSAELPDKIVIHLDIPNNETSPSFISWLFDTTNVLAVHYPGSSSAHPGQQHISVNLECRAKDYEDIKQKATSYHSQLRLDIEAEKE